MTTRQILTLFLATFFSLALTAQDAMPTASDGVTQSADNRRKTTATGPVTVKIGGMFSYTNNSVTYTVSTYTDGGVEKMDVDVPEFTLDNTVVGNLTLGAYTVKGLLYDSGQQGFYRDYSKDGITFHFKCEGSVMNIDGDYEFNSEKPNNILVKLADGKVTTIVNTFQMGAMPFGIVSTFTNTTSGIQNVTSAATADTKAYNLQGQPVGKDAKGLVIQRGRKMLRR